MIVHRTHYHISHLEVGNGNGDGLRVRVGDGHSDLLETSLLRLSRGVTMELRTNSQQMSFIRNDAVRTGNLHEQWERHARS